MAPVNFRFRNNATARTRLMESLPLSIAAQVHDLLVHRGFDFDQAIELAQKTAESYKTSTQSVFYFSGGCKIKIVGGKAKLI